MSNSTLTPLTVLGIDIGGSHITAALVNMERRCVIPESKVRHKIDSQGPATLIVESWSAAILEAIRSHPVYPEKIGIAMPGPFDYEKGVSYIKGQTKYDALYGLNVKELLANSLHVSPEDIVLNNDAACFLQGEVFGAVENRYGRAIGLTLGTGVGTASSHNGKANDAALWQMPFRDSIVEDYISTRWFVKRYLELSGNYIKDVKELAGLYPADPNARAVFEEFTQNLTDFLLRFVLMENPEVIILGGNVMKAADYFLPEVKKRIQQQYVEIDILTAKLGEESALIGAACCW